MRTMLWAGVALSLLPSCGTDRMEALDDALQYGDAVERRASIDELAWRTDTEALNLLAEALEYDEPMLERAGNGVVLWARAYDNRRPPDRQGWQHKNPALLKLGMLASRPALEWRVRAKAVWCLGETKNRKAKPYIAEAYAADSTIVAREIGYALDKLGFTENARAFELLRGGVPSQFYDADDRWLLHLEERN